MSFPAFNPVIFPLLDESPFDRGEQLGGVEELDLV